MVCIPTMLKQVIFWCAVFVVAVISAVLIGEMGSDRQVPPPSAQPVPLVWNNPQPTRIALKRKHLRG